jgi:nucleotidyltransferase substrate binding protein (TIGR01987 family)
MEQYLIEEIDISGLLKARDQFEEYRQHLSRKQDRAGAIQAFEFSYERAWKTAKKILEKKGVETASPRDCFREAARVGLISDPKIWFEFLQIRNLTVHTYDESTAQKVVESFDKFSKSLNELITNLEKMK